MMTGTAAYSATAVDASKWHAFLEGVRSLVRSYQAADPIPRTPPEPLSNKGVKADDHREAAKKARTPDDARNPPHPTYPNYFTYWSSALMLSPLRFDCILKRARDAGLLNPLFSGPADELHQAIALTLAIASPKPSHPTNDLMSPPPTTAFVATIAGKMGEKPKSTRVPEFVIHALLQTSPESMGLQDPAWPSFIKRRVRDGVLRERILHEISIVLYLVRELLKFSSPPGVEPLLPEAPEMSEDFDFDWRIVASLVNGTCPCCQYVRRDSDILARQKRCEVQHRLLAWDPTKSSLWDFIGAAVKGKPQHPGENRWIEPPVKVKYLEAGMLMSCFMEDQFNTSSVDWKFLKLADTLQVKRCRPLDVGKDIPPSETHLKSNVSHEGLCNVNGCKQHFAESRSSLHELWEYRLIIDCMNAQTEPKAGGNDGDPVESELKGVGRTVRNDGEGEEDEPEGDGDSDRLTRKSGPWHPGYRLAELWLCEKCEAYFEANLCRDYCGPKSSDSEHDHCPICNVKHPPRQRDKKKIVVSEPGTSRGIKSLGRRGHTPNVGDEHFNNMLDRLSAYLATKAGKKASKKFGVRPEIAEAVISMARPERANHRFPADFSDDTLIRIYSELRTDPLGTHLPDQTAFTQWGKHVLEASKREPPLRTKALGECSPPPDVGDEYFNRMLYLLRIYLATEAGRIASKKFGVGPEIAEAVISRVRIGRSDPQFPADFSDDSLNRIYSELHAGALKKYLPAPATFTQWGEQVLKAAAFGEQLKKSYRLLR